MKHLVEFPLEDGGRIVVEIDEPETGGTVRAGREDKTEKARETFEDALNKVLRTTKETIYRSNDILLVKAKCCILCLSIHDKRRVHEQRRLASA